MNFITNPNSKFFDPLLHLNKEVDLDLSLEQLYSLESLGISNDDLSDYDQVKIDSFRKEIDFDGKTYSVALPWKDDSIEAVPSNYFIAKKCLFSVVKKLRAQNLYTEYDTIFCDMMKEGLIEEIQCDPNSRDHIFVPHRPIIKTEPSSTKIRPVYHCSLKSNEKPSLNESAYAGRFAVISASSPS